MRSNAGRLVFLVLLAARLQTIRSTDERPILAVLEYNRSARRDAGFAAALGERAVAARFAVDFVDIAAEFEHSPAARTAYSSIRSRLAAHVTMSSRWWRSRQVWKARRTGSGLQMTWWIRSRRASLLID